MGHSCIRIVLILVAFVFYAGNTGISYLANTEFGQDSGMYLNDTGSTSDRFYIPITPTSWTFLIWSIIYIWQGVWLVYTIISIFRRVPDESGRYVYQLPIHPPAFFILYTLAIGLTLAWIFLFDRQWIGASLIEIVFIPVILITCGAISVIRLSKNTAFLKSVGLNKDVWLTRLLVQNGIAIYATWTTIATILNFTIVLVYTFDVDKEVACLIGLAILNLLILIWVFLDTFVLDRYVRYLFMPHCVLVFAFSGCATKNYNTDTNYKVSMYIAVLLGLSVFALVEKIFLLIWRHCRQPIKGNITDDVKGNIA